MPGLEKYWFIRASLMRMEADNCVADGLHKAGWKYTSQTVGCRWMWEREIDGTRYQVDTARAAQVQETIDRREYFERYPDELGD